MGIRIRKAMGYGLDDLRRMGGRGHDPRLVKHPHALLNIDGLPPRESFEAWLRERAAAPEPDFGEVDAWLEWSEYTETLRLLSEDPDWRPEHSVIWRGNEQALARVLLIAPPDYRKEWVRHDNAIDYNESIERYGEKAALPRVRRLPGGVFPFVGDWYDGRTGVRLKHFQPAFLRPRRESLVDLDTYATKFGFADAQDLKAWVRPLVPHSVRHICRWLGLFADPATEFSLRPMIYTYWC